MQRSDIIGGLTAILIFLSTASLWAQTQLLVVTQSQAETTGAPDGTFERNEVAVFDPATGTFAHRLTRYNMDVLMGDVDGNGSYDDAPSAIDALCPTPSFVGAEVLGYIFSLVQNTNFLGGVSVKDGDVVAMLPNGGVQIVYTEDTFSTATGCTSIDVDALHVLADGTLIFSFADDETTSLASLTQQNGGDANLDETTVFLLPPAAAEATILFDRTAILGFVNTALGTTLSSVVDTTGITPDPSHGGAYLIALGSANSTLEGTVFTTHNGGQVAQIGGTNVDSATLGFTEQEVLGAISTISPEPSPLVLHHPDAVMGPSGSVDFVISGGTPNSLVQIVATNSSFPIPDTTLFPVFGPRGYVYLNVQDPLANVTLASPSFRTTAGADGRALIRFLASQAPPGLSLTFQAFDAGLKTSLPIADQS